ncbi:hypothetical protein EMIHUDRAFT_235047 [Emiliania huxleyi CCMP1516]|uniref:PH domain-containing protein n=2 Tax=Emiliania huxleyi TaxID=2903 RepID=A0A0D3JX90_EMIH1|nr:hypothetical protein EMIHUDRAFT_235047 [Emiliania huxleyi CCMP1516]EOD28125.1 hypothetical protein EMIHUDRAFT_235047 [Emiliania huxleyi CCMP1516]|eukprot:XP_005780554.1 hypothetical protein EMIHUDRAFT_235047 [Emiliania huxleyi CCMP1516]
MNRSLDGWLSKLATTRSGTSMWQRRWFVLSGDRLQYFNSPGDVGGGDAKWTLELSALGASTSDGPADQADAARFELLAGGQAYSLRADSEVEAEMWRAALDTPTAGSALPAPSAEPPAGMSLFDGLAVPAATPAAAVGSSFGFCSPSPPPEPEPSGGQPAGSLQPSSLQGGSLAGGSSFGFLASAGPGGPAATPPPAPGAAPPPAATKKKKIVRKAPEEVDVAPRVAQTRLRLCAVQLGLLRQRASREGELASLKQSRAAAQAAQAEASAAEEYERAASLAAELEALEGREAELAEGEAEGEASYARAAERQAALLGEQRSLWADQVGEARRCLAAREEVAAREATARESLLEAQEERLGE